MTVYRLSYDRFIYPMIIEPEEYWADRSDELRNVKSGDRKSSFWLPFNGRYYYSKDYDDAMDESTPCPDLTCWHSDFILSEKAKEKIGGVLEKYGELLPVSIEGNNYYYFNLLNSTDAIDPFNAKKEYIFKEDDIEHMKTYMSEDEIKECFDNQEQVIRKIAFLEQEVNDLFVFNTPYDGYAYTYCTDKFKNLIENSGLTSGWSFFKNLRADHDVSDEFAESRAG